MREILLDILLIDPFTFSILEKKKKENYYGKVFSLSLYKRLFSYELTYKRKEECVSSIIVFILW